MNRKGVLTLIIIILLFLFFLYFYNRPHDYEKNYKIANYEITERYSVKDQIYSFSITRDDITYPFLISNDYLNKRNLITNIKYKEEKNTKCILPESDYLKFYPLCFKDNYLLSLNSTDNPLKYNYYQNKGKETSYNDLVIYDLYNKKFLIYNYKGFYYLGTDNKNINIYEDDNYNNEFIYQINNYLLIGHTTDEYFIDSFVIIDFKNGKKEEILLSEKINAKIRFLGHYKSKVYFIDEKEKKEYELNIKKKKIIETKGMILENDTFKEYKVSTIINKDLTFSKTKDFDYRITNNKLYFNVNKQEILLTNNYVTRIIKIDKDSVYYLSNDDLYVYNLYDGDILLINNFEWNFNNDNVIFIF